MSQLFRELSGAERLDWLRLWRSDNVGPITFRALLSRYGTAAAALEALPGLAKRGGRREFKAFPGDAAERELAEVAAAGARLIALCESDYPPLLARIEDAPPLVTLKGHPALLRRPTVAIVGSRNCSANGAAFARRLAGELGKAEWTVVSGLARGIDTAAHQGSLATGTAAVIAGGIDVVYPPENRDLQGEIAARGVVVAEMQFGAEPQARSFVIRNRLISGLARGVVLIEAGAKSGALHTARFAAEQGREVMAAPGSPLDPRSKGCNALIREGATLIEEAGQILEALSGLRRLDDPPLALDLSGPPALSPGETELAKARIRIREKLSFEPVEVDELLRQCQITAPVALTVLLELELAGRIRRHAGGRVAAVAD